MKIYRSFFSFLFLLARANGVDPQDGALTQFETFFASDGQITLQLKQCEPQTAAVNFLQTRCLGGAGVQGLAESMIRVRPGETLRIRYENNLVDQALTNPDIVTEINEYSNPDESNLHFHGAHISGEGDTDHSTVIVGPGTSFDYAIPFRSDHSGGTFWIHPHRHGSGTLQVGGGAAMPLIVEDPPGTVPPEVANAEEVILMVQHIQEKGILTRAAGESGDQLFQFTINDDVGDEFLLVNGKYRPFMKATAGKWQRWRVIWADWDNNPLDLSISTDSCEMYLLAKDGIYITDYPRQLDVFPIPTGGRADIMVRCTSPGSYDINSYEDGRLMTLVVEEPGSYYYNKKDKANKGYYTPYYYFRKKDKSDKKRMLLPRRKLNGLTEGFDFPRPSYLDDLSGETPDCTCETLMDDEGAAGDSINERKFQIGEFLHTSTLGEVQERELDGLHDHPYHQHVYPYQLIDLASSNTDDRFTKYFQIGDYQDSLFFGGGDTERRTATIRYRPDNFVGRMSVHCHKISHSDQGMLAAEDIYAPESQLPRCQCSARIEPDERFTRPNGYVPCQDNPNFVVKRGKKGKKDGGEIRNCAWAAQDPSRCYNDDNTPRPKFVENCPRACDVCDRA